MENLDKSQFIVLLETSLNRRLLSPEQKTLDAAYEDYIDLLHGLTVQSCKSSLDLLHELARLQSCLMRLQERIVEKESPQVLLLGEEQRRLGDFDRHRGGDGRITNPGKD